MTCRNLFRSAPVSMVVVALALGGLGGAAAQDRSPRDSRERVILKGERVTPAQRKSAAEHNLAMRRLPGAAARLKAVSPLGVPHYFGPYANYANSPVPAGSIAAVTVDTAGSGYSSPLVDIVDAWGTGAGATAAAAIDPLTGGIASITVTAPGGGYTAPIILITDPTGAGAAASPVLGALTGGIHKFVDTMPPASADPTLVNNLGQQIPIAIADTATYPGDDYYEIALVETAEQMHSDLPPTRLREYVQLWTPNLPGAGVPLVDAIGNPILLPDGSQALGVTAPHYLGPLIISQRDRAVRVTYFNLLPTGDAGNLFIPVDYTFMSAGPGPDAPMGTDCNVVPKPDVCYPENRGVIHLHGALIPWISDGTPSQWTAPVGETSSLYLKGLSVGYVPDMWFDAAGNVIPGTVGITTPPQPGATNNPGPGVLTYYYNNQQSARLQFYHDHVYGTTRLDVYVGEAAAYLITDQVEADLINGTNTTGVNPGLVQVLPDVGIPLVVQDKTFIDANTIMAQDPTWRWGTGAPDPITGVPAPQTGDLWFPHVYMPAQNPWDITGASAFGRWMYGPWFFPPTPDTLQPVPNPYYTGPCPADQWCEPPEMPQVPDPSSGMEAFNDTPTVNGTLYPTLTVEPKTYRFRVLSIADDRFFNLHMYVAADKNFPTTPGSVGTVLCDGTSASLPTDCTEVKMVQAVATPGFPAAWSTDGRVGGVPDPATAGPSWIQIGTEGGFLPAPVVVPPQPVNWNYNATAFNFGNVTDHSLLLGPAERADVLVDFSQYAGKTLIVYNDAPAAFPALDPRYDYYSGDPSQMDTGGAPTTQPGYGPNTRTVMQIQVLSARSDGQPIAPYDLAALESVFAMNRASGKRGVFEASQDPPIVPQAAYDSAYDTAFPNTVAEQYSQIMDLSKTFTPIDATTGLATMPPVNVTFENKAIHDEMGAAYDKYGRMSGLLGLELPGINALNKNILLFGYASPPTDLAVQVLTDSVTAGDGTQIWKITHNGVDTHPVHVHLFNVQLINRVAWDGALLPPDPNELGWKETVRVNPLEDTIIALRPTEPTQPWDVPNNVRLIDPSLPEGAMLMAPPGGYTDVAANAITIYNHYVNYGWEYVWHCHILSHEEMDMMHTFAFAVVPRAPIDLAYTDLGGNRGLSLAWTDGSMNETSFIVQTASLPGGPWTTLATIPGVAGSGSQVIYTDTSFRANRGNVYYQIFAENVVGDTFDYGAGTVGFPTKTTTSAVLSAGPPAAPSNVVATAGTGQVTITWTDNAADEAGFTIMVATSPTGKWKPLSTTIPPSPGVGGTVTFTDTKAKAGTTYYYQVFASNVLGDSVPVMSNPVIPN